jgi:undecaprenyl-diphosphatase
VALCDQISVHAFKEVFQRLRPCHDPAVQSFIREVGNRCGGEFGFVSSHAANSVGLAVFLSRTLRGVAAPVSWLIPSMAIWAFLTSYSRVYIGVHYPTDVLAGAALGALIGGFMGYFHGVMRPLLPKFSR